MESSMDDYLFSRFQMPVPIRRQFRHVHVSLCFIWSISAMVRILCIKLVGFNLTRTGVSTMPIRRFLHDKRMTEECQGYSRKMWPAQGVSYPRSGHGAVYRIARRYFGEAFIYCDTNNKKICGCESVPCINPERTFAKNHDFGLQNSDGVPIIPSERYLIQFRSPVRSIVSNYYLFRYRKLSRHRKSEWREFALRSIAY